MAQERKVAIVGMGGLFPGCKDIDEFEGRLFKGDSFIRDWDLALAHGKNIRSTIAGYLTEEEMGISPVYSPLSDDYPETYIDHLGRIPDIHLATADLGSIWSMIASQDAIKMAGWTTAEIRSEQTGVVIGSGGAGHVILRTAWHNFFELKRKTRLAGSHTVDRAMVYRDAANVSCLIRNRGICEAIGSACATGLGNIGYAYRLIKFGLQDRVVAGGVESNSLETFIGFDAMQVLSKGFPAAEGSRPFDRKRNGFVCSFGCGIVALEEYESAKSRGANILAVIDNYYNNADGDGNMFYPSFDGQRRLWKGLMKNHLIQPDVVKVHGTSTPVGDNIELLSVIDAMGDEGYQIAAPKSQFGHMLGAAGSVELISALMMMKRQEVLPCLNADELNPELENFQQEANWDGPRHPVAAYRHLISTETLKREINQVVCLNYGFGGTNSAISLSKDN
ncbi:beta-ketoacyl-acyl-carrier-protein synthase II [compost metagenome]